MFEIFNYNFEYPKNEDVLILTEPNGFGKTQILNIIFNLFSKNFLFFNKLVFSEITVFLNNNISVKILKDAKKEKVTFEFLDNNNKIESFSYGAILEQKMFRELENRLPIQRIGKDKWINHRTDKIVSIDELIDEYSEQLPTKMINDFFKIKTKKGREIFDSINVYLIREQRLFRKVKPNERNYRRDREQTIMTETIQIYSDELRELIEKSTQRSYAVSQELDSSYPNRLISEKKTVTKEEYDNKFVALKEKQDKLMKNGLYENTQKVLKYSQSDAKALLVYLNDLEKN